MNLKKKCLPKTTICARINIVVSRRVGMADDADSKSVAGNRVRVQVPLPASNQYNPNLFPIGNGFGLFVFFRQISVEDSQKNIAVISLKGYNN